LAALIHFRAISTSASISTGAPKGNSAKPTAEGKFTFGGSFKGSGGTRFDELVKSHKNVSLLTKRECYFILSTDIIKIYLFVRDDK
jgi:hypothetical protein